MATFPLFASFSEEYNASSGQFISRILIQEVHGMSSHDSHLNEPGVKAGRSGNMDDATDTADVKNDSLGRMTVNDTGIKKSPESVPGSYFNWSSCHH